MCILILQLCCDYQVSTTDITVYHGVVMEVKTNSVCRKCFVFVYRHDL